VSCLTQRPVSCSAARWCLALICAVLFIRTDLWGGPDSSGVGSDTLRLHPDSVSTLLRISAKDSVSSENGLPDTGIFQPKKKPWLAVGLSAVVPGAGQIYDERYWKAPVIWGIGGYWVYEWFKQNDKYKQYRDLYDQSLLLVPEGDQRYQSLRDFYRDERDRFAWFLGGLYLLNLVDAYVGAHLYDFDVGPSLGQAGPYPASGIRASVRIPF
jgi:hypothetical protein